MNELKKINERVAKKQIGRFGLGIGSILFGTVLLGKFMYQLGITDNQMFLAKAYPDIYKTLTEKVLEEFEK